VACAPYAPSDVSPVSKCTTITRASLAVPVVCKRLMERADIVRRMLNSRALAPKTVAIQ
jgi:hypothetical protein